MDRVENKEEPGEDSAADASKHERQPIGDGDEPVFEETADAARRAEHYEKKLTKSKGQGFPLEVVFGVTVFSLLLATLWWLYREEPAEKRIFTPEVLAQYNGQKGAPMYLAILGEVFDVSKGAKHYGPGSGYAHFIGKDATRAFVTGDFKRDLRDFVDDFTPEQCAGLIHWRGFYRNHTEYVFKGRLLGRFYNMYGEKRRPLLKVEDKAAQAKSEEERQRELEAQWPRCNVRWSEAQGGFVWCDDGMYPRKLVSQQEGKEPSSRCACFKELGWSDLRQVYPDCSPEAHECRTQPPGKASRPEAEKPTKKPPVDLDLPARGDRHKDEL